MAVWRDDVVLALAKIGGIGTLSEIYSSIKDVRERSLPETWQAIIRRELEHNSSDSESFKGKYDLFFSVDGIGSGKWGLRGCELETESTFAPARRMRSGSHVIRDTVLSRHVKYLHDNQCQICGDTVALSAGKTYSEAHHIIPLGAPHHGPDVLSNLLVVCPNHHVQLDYGAIEINLAQLRKSSGHEVALESIEYHNTKVAVTK